MSHGVFQDSMGYYVQLHRLPYQRLTAEARGVEGKHL